MLHMGERIKKLRQQHNLTQNQLAERFDLSISTISSYEAGTRYPSYEILMKLAANLHTTTDYLISGNNPETVDVTGLKDEEVLAVCNLIEQYRHPETKKEENQ